MSPTTTNIHLYLIPIYLTVVVGVVNVVVIRSSSTLRARLREVTTISGTTTTSSPTPTAHSSWTHKWPYLVPYPFILLILPRPRSPSPARQHRTGGERGMVQVNLGSPSLTSTAGNGNRTTSGGTRSLGSRLFGRTGTGMRTGTTNDAGVGTAGTTGEEDPLSTLLLRGMGRGSGVPPRSATSSRGGRSTPAANTAIATPGTTTAPAPTPSGRVITRGGRRWGRTGSQRSTKTLPLYSEDVGEEDVVLIRKRESLRDAGRGEEGDIVEVDREGEGDEIEDEGEDGDGDEDEDEATADYHRFLASGQDIAEETQEQDPPAHHPRQPPTGRPRATSSVSSISSSDIPARGWGEAPSYDTAVPPPIFNFDADPERSSDGIHTAARFSTQRQSTAGPSPGRGGFRAFVGRLTGGRTETHRRGLAVGDQEEDSTGLMRMSTAGTNVTGGSRARGWSNASGTGGYVSGQTTPGMASQLSLISNVNGNAPASQPMMMSRYSSRLSSFGADDLASSGLPISAPLPGTLIRSSFDAPRKGFSADQVKFLSSTESLGRYGVRVDEDGNPIGDDAVGGRRRGSSVGSMARPSDLVIPAPHGLGWREMAREEQQATVTVGEQSSDRRPARLAIDRNSGVPGVEIEVVPPTPTQ